MRFIENANVTVIRGSATLWRIDLNTIWRYRDLLWIFVGRDISLRYRQSVLGPAWLVIQPLAMTLILVETVGKLLGGLEHGQSVPLYYMTTLIAWGYFNLVVNAISQVFVNNEYLFSKVYFPRILVPLSAVLSHALGALIQLSCLGVLAAILALLRVQGFDFHLLWMLPLALLQIMAFGLGVGLLIATLSAKYRDLLNAMPFLTQALLFLTPVLYPLSRLPETDRLLLAAFNPLSVACDLWQAALLGTLHSGPRAVLLSVASTMLVLAAGVFVFQRAERTVADTI
jgi:lipopolysaccharide transport system permease protein